MRTALLLTGCLGLLACDGAGEAAAPVPEPVEQPAIDVAEAQVDKIAPAALAERLAAGEVQLIDVRTPEEFSDGHIEGAINIPLSEFYPAALPDPDGKDVILYCRTGRRSETAAERLSAQQDAPATHMAGGIVAWRDAGLPVTAPIGD